MCQSYASIRSHQKYSPAWPSTSKLNYSFLHSHHLSSCCREPNVHSLFPESIPHVLFSADWETKAAGRSLTEVRMGHYVPFCAHDTIITSPQLSLVPSRLQAPPGQRPGPLLFVSLPLKSHALRWRRSLNCTDYENPRMVSEMNERFTW